jgi:hypothetical protein
MNMKKKKQLKIFGFTLALVMIALSGCTQEDNKNNLSYVNQEFGFGLNPPLGWTQTENTQDLAKFICPDQNDYPVNLGIKTPIESNGTLNNVVEQLIEYYSNVSFKNFLLLSSEPRTINGLNAYEMVYSEGQEPYMLQHKQVLFEKNNKIYSLTYISLVSTYDRYISVVDQSINSFTII